MSNESVKARQVTISEPGELVKHPRHYNAHPAGVECIAIIEEMTFNVGSAMKYLWRAGLKPGEETLRDLKKAQEYIQFEIERVERRRLVAKAAP